MDEKNVNKDENEEIIYEEEGTFGYGATIVFLVFIAFVIYFSW